MRIETQMLKEWYARERGKLEAHPVFQREANLNYLNAKKRIITEIKWDLTSPETLITREFITQHIKNILFPDQKSKHEMAGKIEEINSKERQGAEGEWEENYTNKKERIKNETVQYAEFFHQFEKVNKIENELKSKGLDPETVYKELTKK